jgi:hypothetical protein
MDPPSPVSFAPHSFSLSPAKIPQYSHSPNVLTSISFQIWPLSPPFPTKLLIKSIKTIAIIEKVNYVGFVIEFLET